MVDNIGGRMKSLAHKFLWIGVGICMVVGFVLIIIGVTEDVLLALVGLVLMTVGSLVSWVTFLLFYEFGQLIENSDKLVNNATEE